MLSLTTGRKAAFAAAAVVAGLAMVGSARGNVVINEALINPPGTDDNREFVELRSTAPATDSLNNYWLLEIETDSATARGTVDLALNLSTVSIASSGLILIGDNYATTNPYAAMTVPGTTLVNLNRGATPTIEQDVNLLLVTNFTGAVGTDYDVDNDGVIDAAAPWASIIDSIALRAADLPQYGGASVTNSVSGTPDAASRFPNNTTANSSAAFYGGDLLTDQGYDSTKASTNFPLGGLVTPGAQNAPVPEPTALGLIGCGGLLALRRRRRMVR